MRNSRPRLKIPLSALDIVLELTTLTVLLILFLVTLKSLPELSESIPVHFNALGEVDAYGDRSKIWFLPALASVLSIGMMILSRFPHIHNFSVKITAQNAYKNYSFSIAVIRWVNLITTLILGFIQYSIIQKGLGHNWSLGSWFMPLIIGSSLLLPIFILLYSQKINKT